MRMKGLWIGGVLLLVSQFGVSVILFPGSGLWKNEIIHSGFFIQQFSIISAIVFSFSGLSCAKVKGGGGKNLSSRNAKRYLKGSLHHREVSKLRQQLISKMGLLDPTMCLPKALCGLSSTSTVTANNNQLVKYYLNQMQKEITKANEDIIRRRKPVKRKPIIREESDEESHTKNKRKRKRKKKKKKKPVLEDEESNESESDEGVLDEVQIVLEDESGESESEEDENDSYIRGRQEMINSNNAAAAAAAAAAGAGPPPMDSDELAAREDYRERIAVQNLMKEEELGDTSNWWSDMPEQDLPTVSWSSPEPSYLPTRMFSWISSLLPSFSWGFGRKPQGSFEDDPFFSESRSMKPTTSKKRKKRKSKNNVFKNVTRHLGRDGIEDVEKRRKAVKMEALVGLRRELLKMKDPMRRLKTSVSIGKRIDHPSECNFLFSTCPFTYQEVLEIIDESPTTIRPTPSPKTVPTTSRPIYKPPKYVSTHKSKRKKVPSNENPTTTFQHQLPNGDGLEINLRVSEKDEHGNSHYSESEKYSDREPAPVTTTLNPNSIAAFQKINHLYAMKFQKPMVLKYKNPIISTYPALSPYWSKQENISTKAKDKYQSQHNKPESDDHIYIRVPRPGSAAAAAAVSYNPYHYPPYYPPPGSHYPHHPIAQNPWYMLG